MASLPPLVLRLAIVSIVGSQAGCTASRYYLALPPVRAGLGSEDRPCVLSVEVEDWRRDTLTQQKCGAWTDREMSDIMEHAWVFFPHFAIGATSRVGRDCPTCWLDVQRPKGDDAVQITLHVPPDQAVMARYVGGLSDGLFTGPGKLEMARTPSCTRYCQDFFIVDGVVADALTVEGVWREGLLEAVDGFQGSYAREGAGHYEGGLRFDPLRGLLPHGEGTWRGDDGSTYDGGWRDGVRDGRGGASAASGERYDGGWRDGRWHGDGVLASPDGARFEGTFASGRRVGHGVQRYADGTIYEGLWVDDLPEGPGVRTGVAGVRVSGTFERGALLPGAATLEWPDGARFEGRVTDGLPHGRGVWVWADGSAYDGSWEHGRPAGRGVVRWPDGALWMGPWIDGQPAGCGLLREPGAEPVVGTWVLGLPSEAGCRAAPDVWAKDDLPGFEAHGLVADAIVTTWWAQRQRRAEREAAAARYDAGAPRFVHFAGPERADAGDGEASVTDDEPSGRTVRFGLAWPATHKQRLVHPSCRVDGGLSVSVDGEAAEPMIAGVLDLAFSLELPGGTTPTVCATLEGACGAWTGCAAVDVPPDRTGAVVFSRVPLDAVPDR